MQSTSRSPALPFTLLRNARALGTCSTDAHTYISARGEPRTLGGGSDQRGINGTSRNKIILGATRCRLHNQYLAPITEEKLPRRSQSVSHACHRSLKKQTEEATKQVETFERNT